VAENPKGSIVHGQVISVDAKGATIDLGNGVEGTLRSSELARERIDDARSVLNVGDDVEAKFVNVDKKNRAITLSIRAKESAEEAEMLQDYTRKSSTGTATLGDILKEQMGQQED